MKQHIILLVLIALLQVGGIYNAQHGVEEGSVVSPANQTTTALSADATWTGTYEDVSGFDTVMTAVKADQNGTFYMEFSDTGSGTADSTLTYNITANINEVHRLSVTRQYYRSRFVNGSTNQTSFEVTTLYGSHPILSSPNNLAQGLDADAINTRPTNILDEIHQGLRTGVTSFHKFGYNTDLDAASGEQVIWGSSSVDSLVVLEAADTFVITYDGTGGGSTDGAGTTGATSLLFSYIDANGDPVTATHTLGTDGSDTTSFTGFGINRIIVSGAGSNNTNASAITVADSGGSNLQAVIPAGTGATQQALYFNGNNHVTILRDVFVNVNKVGGSSPVITVKGYFFSVATSTVYEVFRNVIDTGVENNVPLIFPVGFSVSEQGALYFVGDTDTNDTVASIRFEVVTYAKN